MLENKCPLCSELPEVVARDFWQTSSCKNGHTWHICCVHDTIVLGEPKDRITNGLPCTCTKDLKLERKNDERKVCMFCKHWERDRSVQYNKEQEPTVINKNYGECDNTKFYKSFSKGKNYLFHEHGLVQEFPMSHPDEEFGCVFWVKKVEK